MALAQPGFVQKVMEKVMPQSWAVGRSKATPKFQAQRSQALNERPDSALSPPLERVLPIPIKGTLGADGCAGKLGLC